MNDGFDPRWLEFGITGGLLAFVIVYILSRFIPSMVKNFREGLDAMARVQREMRDEVRDLKEVLVGMQTKCNENCAHDREKIELRLNERIGRLESSGAALGRAGSEPPDN